MDEMSKYGFFDLHRHDEASAFDGLGTPSDLAEHAVELGYEALGVSNHGVTYTNVKHFYSCKDNGIKPVLGCEVYFQPKFLPEEKRGFHLCLFAKNDIGFFNMNKIITAAEETKYYTSKVTFEYLKEYSEGVICTSACVAGPISQAIINNNKKRAEKLIKTFAGIFGDDFYIEIQPYAISDPGVQEDVNRKLIKLAQKHKIKCILTSDSHMRSKDDFDTYLKMHEIGKGGLSYDIKATYGERYMPTEKEIIKRFVDMHKDDFGKDIARKMAIRMCKNLKEIQEKVSDDILDNIGLSLPKFFGDDAFEELLKKIREGLKRVGKQDEVEYKKRAKAELKVIKHHGFEDYFLIVADYVNWAKDNDIAVGPGRGSVCNSLVSYLLNITTVDPIKFGLDFDRFLRMDKKKLPDVDLDFAMNRRKEVVEYIVEKYNAAQIASYGLYKVDNLLNDLAKVCGLKVSGAEMTYSQKQANAQNLKDIKTFVRAYEANEGMKWDLMEQQQFYKRMNDQYDNILLHFRRMFSKLRFIGTHAAGLVVAGNDLCHYAPLKMIGDKGGVNRKLTVTLDMTDLETINAVKFDTLGLKTMEGLAELRRMTGKPPQWNIADTKYLTDEKIYKEFAVGNTDGIFQFVTRGGKGVLQTIHADCFEDVSAASSMNRPGPLQTGMPKVYGDAKEEGLGGNHDSRFYKYTSETYGTIVYQEQIMAICRHEAQMEPEDVDKILKMMKLGGTAVLTGTKQRIVSDRDDMRNKFVKGCIKSGITKRDADSMFDAMCVYAFNKGHAVGYSLISLEEMYYKVYYPTYYWTIKLKFAVGNEAEYGKYQSVAVANGELIFLPHVNYSADTRVRRVDDTDVIQLGTSTIKGIGQKAADFIAEERKKRPFRDYDDFVDRCLSRQCNKRAIGILQEQGAIEFNKKRYLSRVTKFNSTLYTRGIGR